MRRLVYLSLFAVENEHEILSQLLNIVHNIIGLDEPIEQFMPVLINQKVALILGDAIKLVETKRQITIRK